MCPLVTKRQPQFNPTVTQMTPFKLNGSHNKNKSHESGTGTGRRKGTKESGRRKKVTRMHYMRYKIVKELTVIF